MALRKQVPISSKNSRAARTAHAKAKRELKTYDTSAIEPKKSKAWIVVLAIVIIALLVILFFTLSGCGKKSVEVLPEGSRAVVEIEQGEGARSIAEELMDARIIANSDDFLKLVSSKGAEGSLIPGSYTFHGGMTQEEVLDVLLAGPASTADSLTIPEGLTRDGVAQAVDKATSGRISADQFLEATKDASVYASEYPFLAEAQHESLEGFLFPKTYSVTASDDAKSVTKMMLSQFEAETKDLDWSYPESAGLSLYDALKLASIVEKESNPENGAKVASVFYNRLASDRPYLESDATTAYEVGHDPTAEEVHADTPYGTYANPGLPPTPICNPSLACLQAVCSPEETDYMYFFVGSDGIYDFSVTYDDHRKAIAD